MLNVINLDINKLIPYINNPRNNENAIDKVASSIKEFGFKVPEVIDQDNVIVDGHTRVLASKKLGLKEIPCVVADDLSEAQIKAFRIADNKVSEYASWDEELLKLELEQLEDMNFSMSDFDLNLEYDLFNEEVKKEENKEVEIEFTEELLERHNYVVLYFDNEIDWIQAETLFDIKTVKAKNEGREMKGVGRVLNGSKALNNILKGMI
jgi:site-specific DNA-methyltransferase (adenine-specific)